MYALGATYSCDDYDGKNLTEAAAWYQKAADAGVADAMTALGNAYASGLGVKKNKEKAMEWYQKAAEAGERIAMNLLGYWQ